MTAVLEAMPKVAAPTSRVPATVRRSPATSHGWCPAGAHELDAVSGRRSPPLPPKLVIGRSDDPAENEADRVAAKVLRMPAHDLTLQRSASAAGVGAAPPIVHHVLSKPGRPLDGSTRAYFEPRLGADLSTVRVHDDAQAAQSARAVGATAYTVGNHIAFAESRHTPATEAGRRLLAHELTHVVQQRFDGTVLRRFVDCTAPGHSCPPREHGEEARAAAAPMVVLVLNPPEHGIAIVDFAIDSSSVKSSLAGTAYWTQFVARMVQQQHEQWEILGFSDCQGSATTNAALRRARAAAIHTMLPSDAQRTVIRVGAAPAAECLTGNDSASDRTINRAVVIRYAGGYAEYTFDPVVVEGEKPPVPHGRATVGDCTTFQAADVRRAIAQACTWMNRVEPDVAATAAGTADPSVAAIVRAAVTTNFHTSSAADLTTIAGNLASIRAALNGSPSFACVSSFSCGSTELAYVRGRFGWIRRLMDVNLCPLWFRCGSWLKRVGTIVHEIAHQHPGADDKKYEWDPAYGTLPTADALDNADSYAVLVRQIFMGGAHGPGESC